MAKTAIRRALFLFPTDTMGGAENVTRMVAAAALKSDKFDEIICFILSLEPTDTLSELAKDPRVKLVYSGAKGEKTGLLHLLKILIQQRYDLVFSSHTHLNAVASLLRKLKLLRTKRLVARESTMIFERDLGLRGKIACQLYRVYGAQDLIICQTERMANSLRKNTQGRLSAKTVTLPNPIDLESIALARDTDGVANFSLPENADAIVWCGRLQEVKSPLRAVDALAALHGRGFSNTHLVMIGGGSMREAIIDHASKLGLDAHLTLTGRVSAPAAIMQHCRLGLMTSDTEGFPNVILEMLAAGVSCVVTTNCAGGLADIPGVQVAPDNSPMAIADELAVALDDTAQKAIVIKGYLEQRTPSRFFNKLLAQ